MKLSRIDYIGQNGNEGDHYVSNIVETKHFSKGGDQYFSCPCCGKGGLSIALLIVLEHVRMHFNAPVIINSGARCVEHNRAVSVVKHSEHIVTDEEPLADAADIVVKGVSPTKVVAYLKSLPYANLLGIGRYKGRTHVDTRGLAARW